MPSQLYFGEVMHRRLSDIPYQFKYPVVSICLDVDQFAEEVKQHRLISLNKWNLFSIYVNDYGKREKGDWRAWCENIIAEYGEVTPVKRIELVCFPRMFGFTFNPLAMWYLYNQSDEMMAVIAEVSNTFGQWHHYVLTNQGHGFSETIEAEADKVFHVSPFIGMSCQYHFSFQKPSENYRVRIFETEDGEPRLEALHIGKSRKLNDRSLFKAALKFPFNTLMVMFRIHWWALKIWFKGGQFHKTPESQTSTHYGHAEMKKC